MSLPIQTAITAALNRHGPRTTQQLLRAVQETLPDTELNAYHVAQQCIRLQKTGSVEAVKKNTRAGTIWQLSGDPRLWVRDMTLRQSIAGLGMDAENLEWMQEMQARRAARLAAGARV